MDGVKLVIGLLGLVAVGGYVRRGSYNWDDDDSLGASEVRTLKREWKTRWIQDQRVRDHEIGLPPGFSKPPPGWEDMSKTKKRIFYRAVVGGEEGGKAVNAGSLVEIPSAKSLIKEGYAREIDSGKGWICVALLPQFMPEPALDLGPSPSAIAQQQRRRAATTREAYRQQRRRERGG